ncbi:MAG: hypothetical protein ACTSYY_09775 [Promethearchaeota archaeon]
MIVDFIKHYEKIIKLPETHRKNISAGRLGAHITTSASSLEKQLETKRKNYYLKHFPLKNLDDKQVLSQINQINKNLEIQIRSGKKMNEIAKNLQQEPYVIRRIMNWNYNTRNLREVRTILNPENSITKIKEKKIKKNENSKINKKKFLKKIADDSTFTELMHEFNIQSKYQMKMLIEQFCGTNSLVKARELIKSKKKSNKIKSVKDNLKLDLAKLRSLID